MGSQHGCKSQPEGGGEPLHVLGEEEDGTRTSLGLLPARWRSHSTASMFSVKWAETACNVTDFNIIPQQRNVICLSQHLSPVYLTSSFIDQRSSMLSRDFATFLRLTKLPV